MSHRDVYVTNWQTGGETWTGCVHCEWKPDAIDETAAARRHVAANPTHIVSMRREQTRVVRTPASTTGPGAAE